MRARYAAANAQTVTLVQPPAIARDQAHVSPAQRPSQAGQVARYPQAPVSPEPPARVIEMELEPGEEATGARPRRGSNAVIECPRCSEQFQIPLSMLGFEVTCPMCGYGAGCPDEAAEDKKRAAGVYHGASFLACPSCKKEFKLPEGCEEGMVLECPYCGARGLIE